MCSRLITELLWEVESLSPLTRLTHQLGGCSQSNWSSLVGPQSSCDKTFCWRLCVVALLVMFFYFVCIGLGQISSFILLPMFISIHKCLGFSLFFVQPLIISYSLYFYDPAVSSIGKQLLKIFANFRPRVLAFEGSLPEMRIWYILLIISDLKWCIHLSRSLFLYNHLI